MQAFPQPLSFGLRFDFCGDFHRELVQSHFRQFGSGSAIVPGIGSRSRQAEQLAISHHTRHGRLARRLFPIPQDLAQKGPHHHGRRVDLTDTEEVFVLGENPLDPFRGENTGERQSRLRQKHRHNRLKTATVHVR